MVQAQLFSLFSVITGTFSQSWSMTVPPVVNSTIGGDVVLPCSFTHPKQQDYSKGITVQWVTRQFHDKPFFQCKVKNVTTGGMNECSVPESYQRFSVKGDPKQRDLSLLIRDLAVTDNGVYFCRVELDYYWGDGKWQTASGTQLNIIAKAHILSLSWVEASLGPGNGSLRCVVEGNPPSTITWFSSSKGNIDPGVSTIGTHPFQRTSSIPYFTQEVYTCRAENSLGRAERRFPPGPTALTVALSVCGVLLLLLLLGVALFYLRKRGYLRFYNSEKIKQQSDVCTDPAIAMVSESSIYANVSEMESPQSLYKHNSPEDGDMELNLVYSDVQLNATTQSPQRSSRVPIPDEGVHYAIVKLG
uniref:sialic acid binding Ig-like lectin 15, like n=1 Tax=Oncorhynchus gorbuscha TaxID=8017 RepID=UPI001EAF3F65|nr:sialic acid binding Ig-like lectin 15, like [Oncorhynchus gorbuscha]